MALDTELLFRSTESLLSPTDRRFFPFKIPNSHQQLRHYISTADPDRIYVAVGRIIYSIHISTQKREIITIVPFDPKCLTAGYGWIAVGGTESGDCAFVNLDTATRSTPRLTATTASPGDVDSPLPLEIDPPVPRRHLTYPPNVVIRELGGSIVNSVTLHRLPPDGDEFDEEDIAILSNNDTTVSIYSLPRMEVIHSIRHAVCMNYAIMSPDSRLLAAVGDDNRVFFYRAIPSSDKATATPTDGDKLLREWSWPLLRSVELHSIPRNDDKCCFTIAFSPSSHLCAVASQAGIITVFSVEDILKPDPGGRTGREDILCVFRSSRPYEEGGAVRSMTFSPDPWDLLVWVEDRGRAGVADVRQAFSRRQIINLDIGDPSLERVVTENLDKPEPEDQLFGRPESAAYPAQTRGPFSLDDGTQHGLDSRYRRRRTPAETESQIMRESLARDLTARERQIIDFLNTARWASTIEEGPQRLPQLLNSLPFSSSRSYQQRTAAQTSDSPPPPPPFLTSDYYIGRSESSRNPNSERSRLSNPRRRNSVVLSQDGPRANGPASSSTALIAHPGISLRWPYSPNQGPALGADPDTTAAEDNFPHISSSSANDDGVQIGPSNTNHRSARVNTEDAPSDNRASGSSQRQRLLRSRSIPRRADRAARAPGERPEQRSLMDSELRSTITADRLRVQRQTAVEESQYRAERAEREQQYQREQQYRRVLELDGARLNPRLYDLGASELSSSHDREVGTAGVGWSEDGRTLYIGTEKGIFEYHIDMLDRRYFPALSFR